MATLERFVLSSRVFFHLSSSQTPSITQGADTLQGFALSHRACKSKQRAKILHPAKNTESGEGKQQHHPKTQMQAHVGMKSCRDSPLLGSV